MDLQKLIKGKTELTGKLSKSSPVVISSRIRLARNLSNIPFPGWAKSKQKREVLSKCREVVEGFQPFKGGLFVKMEDLTELEKLILVERHLISKELTQSAEAGAMAVDSRQARVIMINEEDHLRIQVLKSGFNFNRIWKTIDELDSAFEKNLDYSFSPELGYLTACPTNLGTGMRASVMMHLSALVLSNQMEKVIRAVGQLGIAVRGIYGEGSDATGSIFQISNQQTLGESEKEILKRLSNVLKTVIEHEYNAREKLFETERNMIQDKIGRAYGVLKHGYLLNSGEAMNLLSLLRLSVDIGMLETDWRDIIDRLFIENQPAHIQVMAERELEPSERDAKRAEHLRRSLIELPEPDFNKLTF